MEQGHFTAVQQNFKFGEILRNVAEEIKSWLPAGVRTEAMIIYSSTLKKIVLVLAFTTETAW